jgi:hypothetical protein
MFNYIMVNHFITVDPFNNYRLFMKLIRNKDKIFLTDIQKLIDKRLLELK